MEPEHIEALMAKMGLKWQRLARGMWAVDDPEGKIPKISICVEPSLKKGEDLLKFIIFICDIPRDTGPKFFREFLKLNFRVDHGTFALETSTEMEFMDTLELKNLDGNEFEETLRAMMEAPKTFQERYDINRFTMGEPQF